MLPSQTRSVPHQLPATAAVAGDGASLLLGARAGTSIFSMTSRTRLRLSMKELVATRSMRLVVARYSTSRTDPGASSGPLAPPPREKERRTRGDSSLSTEMADRATEARRGVGKGMERDL